MKVVAVNIVPQNSLQEWRAFWKSFGAGDVVWAQDTDAAATSYKKLRAEVLKALN